MFSSPRVRRLLPVLVITLITAILRLVRLDSSLWYDELFSLLRFFRWDPLTVMTTMPDPNNHVLYSLMAHACIYFFGDAEWSVRLPAVIMGLAGVPVLYWLAEKYSGPKVAALASLLLAVSMWHVWFSQDARGYSGMITLCLLGQGLFLEMIDTRSYRVSIAYIVCMTAAGYLHLFSVFTLAAHFIALLLISRGRLNIQYRTALRTLLVNALLLALLYSPLLKDMLTFVRTEGQLTSGRELSLSFIARLPIEWVAQNEHSWAAWPLFIFFVMGLVAGVRKYPRLLIVGFFPLVMAMLFVLLAHVFIYYRMLSFFLPWYFWFAAGGLDWISARLSRGRALVFIGGTLLFIAICAFPLIKYYRLGKQPFKEVAAWVETVPRDVSIFSFGIAEDEFQHYCTRAKTIPWLKSIGPAVEQGGILIGAYSWSFGAENSKLLQARCSLLKTWPAAGYEDNKVYVFRCPGNEGR